MTMPTCKFQKKVERWFDGELTDTSHALEDHVAACTVCSRYLSFLKQTRGSLAESSAAASISDAQLPAFWSTIEQEIDGTRQGSRPRKIWALASLASAALISAVALLSIVGNLGGGPAPVAAETEVIDFNTELPGAEAVVLYHNDTPTLFLDMGDYDYAGDGEL